MPELHLLVVLFGTHLLSNISTKASKSTKLNAQLALFFGASKVNF
jgi:hypothetical protein